MGYFIHYGVFFMCASYFCSNLVHSCSKPLAKVDEKAKRMILESLELQTYVDEFFGSTDYVFRLTRYKEIQGENLGLAGHTDGNYLTIVSQNGINGVQIFNKNVEWIDVNISQNSCIVIVGDALMVSTISITFFVRIYVSYFF